MEANIGLQKVIMLYGTRRTGKTTIIENIVLTAFYKQKFNIVKLNKYAASGPLLTRR